MSIIPIFGEILYYLKTQQNHLYCIVLNKQQKFEKTKKRAFLSRSSFLIFLYWLERLHSLFKNVLTKMLNNFAVCKCIYYRVTHKKFIIIRHKIKLRIKFVFILNAVLKQAIHEIILFPRTM